MTGLIKTPRAGDRTIAWMGSSKGRQTNRQTTEAVRNPGNTGLSDPSVNQGQTARMKKFRGHVLRSMELSPSGLRNGKQTTIEIDAETTGDKRCCRSATVFQQDDAAEDEPLSFIDKSEEGLKTENGEAMSLKPQRTNGSMTGG